MKIINIPLDKSIDAAKCSTDRRLHILGETDAQENRKTDEHFQRA